MKKAAGGKPATLQPQATPEAASPAPSHISPEEAVAHIQALLEAKQERVKKGPTWPGASTAPSADNGQTPAANGNHSGDIAHNHVAHARGDQSKNGKT
ncbi:hypothetical protein [Dyella acidiphila]|uniref:Uncharacterized protein n=1 Tax=Dyella acidiphila TaxID=2775866 RepID=A0ABR9G6V8_9GAMM|nr:hypothetical protein [Dyella acidiphila]MBE1159782.1 hypothetical protein [Dyella acidiphila]